MNAVPPQPSQPQPQPPLLPDEKFWKRYSPHFELPLAGATSLLLHGLVLGVLTFGGLAFLLQGNIEAQKPPSMDVVQVQGDDGDGRQVGGGIVGDPNGDGQPRTEIVEAQPMPPNTPQEEMNVLTAAPMVPVEATPLPNPDLPATDVTEVESSLAKLIESANIQSAKPKPKKPAPVTTPRATPKAIANRGSGSLGTGGQGKYGSGTGRGTGHGPGTGIGGIPGARNATQQEVYAYRWRFDLAGDGKQHADKLAKVGFILAFPEPGPSGGYLVVSDITRRPAELRKNNLAAFKGAVKLYNRVPYSIQQLAQELQLPYVPQYLILMLPKDREEKMAIEEARFARQHGRDLRSVQETWFDFRNVGGQYEPFAIRQQ